MSALLALFLPLAAVVGIAIVAEQQLVRQSLLASFFGLVVAAALVVLRAPEVALAELLVTGFVVPALTLLTLLRVERGHDERAGKARSGERE